MSAIDDYRLRVSGTIKSNMTNSAKQLLKNNFKNNPSYYSVTVNTASNPSVTSNLDSWIVDDSKVKELKQIQLTPDQTLYFGDLIYWIVDGVGDYWLTTQVDNVGGYYNRGSMQKCFSSLKWQDSTGAIKEAYFTLTKDTQIGLGINEGKIMILPDERRYITLQNNADTIKIKKEKRFIFDGDRSWKVTSINSLKTGLIELELEETPDLNKSTDNIALRIADYIAPSTSPIPVGTLYISSSSTPINQIKLTQSKVFQSYIDSTLTPVNWEIYDVSKTTTTNLVTIQSSTTTSCTLKANSISQFESVQLKATLQSDATQVYWLQIDVKSIS